MFGLSFQEVFCIGIIAILLFGKRLPDVAKQFGEYYAKFRKSLSEIQQQANLHEIYSPHTPTTTTPKKSYSDFDDRDEVIAPRFEAPPVDPPADVKPDDRSSAA